ncbi:hypothetical protein SynBIOSE41_03882 [Synechococcus sp. BIOS-E4-1]|nr:hypothetical protein SynBIOSE41_03882 [Synechococcus sp. BIOS-E4-1]
MPEHLGSFARSFSIDWLGSQSPCRSVGLGILRCFFAELHIHLDLCCFIALQRLILAESLTFWLQMPYRM